MEKTDKCSLQRANILISVFLDAGYQCPRPPPALFESESPGGETRTVVVLLEFPLVTPVSRPGLPIAAQRHTCK